MGETQRIRRLGLRLLAVAALTIVALGACQEGAEEEATLRQGTQAPTITQTVESAATPGGTETPQPSDLHPAAAAPLYIALGDSLATGGGASDPATTAYVPLFHRYLQGALDEEKLALMNLGDGGDTSTDLIAHGHLARAISEIEARNQDQIAGNDVKLVTVDIGGDDLLQMYFSAVLTGTCPDLSTSLETPECIKMLQDGLEEFANNFDQALGELAQADPNLPILTMTVYNPFSGSGLPHDDLAEFAMEGAEGSAVEEGLNDVIRSIAEQYGVPVADVHSRFFGKSRELIASDQIHPNDRGYRAIADALIAAYESSSQ